MNAPELTAMNDDLAAQVSELEARAQAVREMHVPTQLFAAPGYDDDQWACIECGETIDEDGRCRTVRTLDGDA